jgi:hypothetical protein
MRIFSYFKSFARGSINQPIIEWALKKESTSVRAELVEARTACKAPFDKLRVNSNNSLREELVFSIMSSF